MQWYIFGKKDFVPGMPYRRTLRRTFVIFFVLQTCTAQNTTMDTNNTAIQVLVETVASFASFPNTSEIFNSTTVSNASSHAVPASASTNASSHAVASSASTNASSHAVPANASAYAAVADATASLNIFMGNNTTSNQILISSGTTVTTSPKVTFPPTPTPTPKDFEGPQTTTQPKAHATIKVAFVMPYSKEEFEIVKGNFTRAIVTFLHSSYHYVQIESVAETPRRSEHETITVQTRVAAGNKDCLLYTSPSPRDQ